MTITLGNQFQVDTAADEIFSTIVEMTSTTAICFYSTNTDAVSARHLTLTGDTITAGTELIIDSTAAAGTFYIRAAKLTTASAMVAYSYGSIHRAQIITVSGGTSLVPGAVSNLTDNTNINFTSMSSLGASSVIYVYSDSASNNGKARILFNLGGSVVEGAAFTYDSNCYNSAVTALSATKAVVVFADASNGDLLTGEVLNISGTTITGNTDIAFSTVPKANQTVFHRITIDALDSTRMIVLWYDNPSSVLLYAATIEESGNSLTIGDNILAVSANAPANGKVAAMSSSHAIAMYSRTNNPLFLEFFSTGTKTILIDQSSQLLSAKTTGWIAALEDGTAIGTWPASIEAIPVFASGESLSLAPMFKPADVDIDGGFIYVSLLLSGTPLLTKLSTDLASDGTTLFLPGDGDNIGVQCSRQDADTLWIAGNFGGTDVIEISEDGGSTFTAIDDTTIGDIRTFIVGPDSESRIIVFDETNGDILETIDGGTTWTAINAAVTPEVNAIARLGTNVQESVFGNDGGANNSINYSVNSGTNLEDFQTGVYPNANATRVIVN